MQLYQAQNMFIAAMQGELHRWYNNCELRSVVLSDPQGDYTHPDIYHFAGHLPQAEQGLKVTA